MCVCRRWHRRGVYAGITLITSSARHRCLVVDNVGLLQDILILCSIAPGRPSPVSATGAIVFRREWTDDRQPPNASQPQWINFLGARPRLIAPFYVAAASVATDWTTDRLPVSAAAVYVSAALQRGWRQINGGPIVKRVVILLTLFPAAYTRRGRFVN